ncbi:hypothetical protein B0H11DRAFT_2289548 [Mycena galericulata]|nr:hypothetical protein B0H11DRAFT_2289548 [Mycena galericulata]
MDWTIRVNPPWASSRARGPWNVAAIPNPTVCAPLHTSTEFWNTKLITEMEERVLPMYHLFAHAIAFLDGGDIGSACDALKSANEILKPALKYFLSSMVDAKMSQQLWLAYVQGYQGWTLDGFDGISGGQSLLIRTLGAFLGIRPFPRPEKESLHLPLAQRA